MIVSNFDIKFCYRFEPFSQVMIKTGSNMLNNDNRNIEYRFYITKYYSKSIRAAGRRTYANNLWYKFFRKNFSFFWDFLKSPLKFHFTKRFYFFDKLFSNSGIIKTFWF